MEFARSLVTRTPHQLRSRAVVKTACYRVFMILVSVGVAFAVTGSVAQSLSIGLVTNLVKTCTYYGYERIWDRIAWGVGSTA